MLTLGGVDIIRAFFEKCRCHCGIERVGGAVCDEIVAASATLRDGLPISARCPK
jgi:hypothetical protein